MNIRFLRVDVAIHLIAAWALALLLPGAIFGSLIVVIAVFSIPFLLFATVTSLWFGASIMRHPGAWSAAAIAASALIGSAIFGRVGLLSIAISVPAAVYFLAILRLAPTTKQHI